VARFYEVVIADVFTVFSNQDYDNDDMGNFWTWQGGGMTFLLKKFTLCSNARVLKLGYKRSRNG